MDCSYLIEVQEDQKDEIASQQKIIDEQAFKSQNNFTPMI